MAAKTHSEEIPRVHMPFSSTASGERRGERTGRRDLNEDDINANQTLLHHLGDAAEEDGDLRRVRLGRDGHT